MFEATEFGDDFLHVTMVAIANRYEICDQDRTWGINRCHSHSEEREIGTEEPGGFPEKVAPYCGLLYSRLCVRRRSRILISLPER